MNHMLYMCLEICHQALAYCSVELILYLLIIRDLLELVYKYTRFSCIAHSSSYFSKHARLNLILKSQETFYKIS